jgi:hypothetical protein
MWALFAILVLVTCFPLWLWFARGPEGTDHVISPPNLPSGVSAKSNAAVLSPSSNAPRSITYELTRWDIFQNQVTIVFRNRPVQVAILAGLVGTEWIVIRGYHGAPLYFVLNACFGAMCNLFAWLAVTIVLLALALSFLFKQRGVVGQHTLEITEPGLSERTAYNENLAKWASIRRLISGRKYLYIYVSDFNYYSVPKRCFARDEIANFEAELRAFAKRGEE